MGIQYHYGQMRVPRRAARYLGFAVTLTAFVPLPEARAQDLPDGPGKEVVQKACSLCHPATMVVGRNLSRDEWSAEVAKMVQQGAKLTDPEFTQVVNYLARNFADTPAPAAAAPAPAGRGPRPAEIQVIDPAAVDRGREVYIAECVTCHGPRARKGTDLVRSVTVLDDRYGNGIGPFLKKGHPLQSGRPSAGLTDAQVVDLSHFLHQKVQDTLRSGPYSQVQNVLTGDAKAGEVYFNGAGGCKTCHSPTGDLAGIAKRYDPPELRQRFLFPRGGGGQSFSPAMVTVRPASGTTIAGTLVYLDDFTVALLDADGGYHSFKRTPSLKVEKKDPLQPHIDLLSKYTDHNVHDIVAYLETLK